MKFVVENKSFGNGDWRPEECFETAKAAMDYASSQALACAVTDHRVVVYSEPRVIATFEAMEEYA